MVLDLSYLYIVSIDILGEMEVIDYFNEVESGGSVCWA